MWHVLNLTFHQTWKTHFRAWYVLSCPGGVMVSVLAARPNGCRFKPGQGNGIFKGDKNVQHTFLQMGSEAESPMS
jgi:hypothetical protein